MGSLLSASIPSGFHFGILLEDGRVGNRQDSNLYFSALDLPDSSHPASASKHLSVLSTVLLFADFRVRGEQYGAIKFAGICSDLQGFAVKGPGSVGLRSRR